MGGSSSRDEFVEETVTPTATTRFYRLLDRLEDKGYLRELNASSGPASFAKALGAVPEGFFIRIAGCKLRVPTYVQMDEIISESRTRISADRAWTTAMYGTEEERAASDVAKAEASGAKTYVPSYSPYSLTVQGERQLTLAAKKFAAAIARNPPVPLSSCTGTLDEPSKPDLLFPVGRDALTTERSLLAGPVTVVGKVVRQLQRPADVYVDRKALAAYTDAVDAMDEELIDGFYGEDTISLGGELADDAIVRSPGAVILPIAIYK